MTRNVTGVFGRGAESAGPSVRGALGPAASQLPTTPQLALAWTGETAAGAGRATVLLRGRVRNLEEIARALGEPGELPAEALLALAYDRWQEGVLARLRGSFAVFAWDAAAERGLLAVDQLGAGSIYVSEAGGRLTFATELKQLVRVLPHRPPPAASPVARWIADGYLARGETLLEGVRRLAGGTVVRLEPGGGWHEASYWQPRYVEPEKLTAEEASARVLERLGEAVRTRLAPAGGTTAIQLSGGLDSSVVAAVARGLGPAGALRAYSLVFPDHPALDESERIEQVETSLELPVEHLPVVATSALATALEFQIAWEVPATSPMLAFNVPLLRRAAADGVGVLLDGEGGDELFGCSEYLIADRIRRGDVAGAVRLARRLPWNEGSPRARIVWAQLREYGLKGAAPAGMHRAVRRLLRARYEPRWLTAEAARAVRTERDEWSWKTLDGPRWWAYLSDLLVFWRERLGAHDLLRQRAALVGLENAHPLLDDLDLVELVLQLPPQLAFHPALTRPLVRDAVAGLLPDSVRLRPDKADFSQIVIESLGGPDRDVVVSLLSAPDAEIRAYVKPEQAEKLLRVPPERRTPEWARLAARLAIAESWLRSQDDPRFAPALLERLR